MGAEAEPVTQVPEEVPASSSEPINEEAPAPAEKEAEVPAEVTKEAELEDGERRHYPHGDVYVTLDEFRDTPMGRDILGDEDKDAAEERLRAKFGHFTREAEHRALGGHFDLQEMADTEKPWEFMTGGEKVETVVVGVTKFFCIWGVLYLFIIALGIMGDAFKILGGRSSGKAFRESELLANPVAGLCIGILATVLMQSSSTTTSIVISMSAADLITVENAAYLVMGANIGTSVTNTIVSIAHLNSKDEYRRAFTGAVYHDMFNWLTVGIFLPLEASSGFLMELASAAVDSLGIENETESTSKIEFIKKITKPAAGRVVSTDKKLIEKIAAAETNAEVKKLEKKTIIKQKSGHVLRDTPISDDEAGVLMLFVSLTMLATCLLMLVKLLQSVLKGRVAIWTRYLLNINSSNKCIRSCGGWDNYLLMLFGTGCTILVQSSSVFTSTLTPLVGIGLIHIEKAVALTQGANIGTTVTGVLSALSGSNVRTGMRVALEHVFFNCLGTCLWFCVWPLRVVPLNMAKFMGETAANLKWFPLAYIVGGFLVFPMLIIGLSIPGWEVLCGIMTPIAIVCLGLTVWIFLRRNRADLLPRSSPVLRGDTAPCGCTYPNFMQLWGGDIDQDAVDLEELREKELARKAREASSREWPYSAAAWGCAILAFLGAALCLPTSQWRRVRYASEGRAEIGFGLWEVCSGTYSGNVNKDQYLATEPRECTLEMLEQCANELKTSCASDSDFAMGATATSSEETVYERSWDFCSKQGCRMHAWMTHCPSLSTCQGRDGHTDRCSAVGAKYQFYHDKKIDTKGVQYTWSVEKKPDTPLPFPNPTYTSSSSKKSFKSQSWDLPKLQTSTGITHQSLSGLAFDYCKGEYVGVTTRNCITTASFVPRVAKYRLRTLYKSSSTQNLVDEVGTPFDVPAVNGRPTRAGMEYGVEETCALKPAASVHDASANGAAFGDVEIYDAEAGIFIAADEYEPKIVVFSKTEKLATFVPNDMPAAPGVYPVLPAEFRNRAEHRGLKSLAFDRASSKNLYMCLASAATGADATLRNSRVTRCAVVSLADGYAAPKLVSQKVVLLPATEDASHQHLMQLTGASHVKGDKVLFVAKYAHMSGGSVDASQALVVQVDFSKGTEVNATGVPADLERLGVDAAGKTQLETASLLFEAGVRACATRVLMDITETVAPEKVSGLAVMDSHVISLVETGDEPKAYVVQLPGEEELSVSLNGKCKKVKGAAFPLADRWSKCHAINDVCPVGDLEGDMGVVAGMAVTGTVFLGLGTVTILVYSLASHEGITGKLHMVSGCCMAVAWVLLLAAWAHMVTLADEEYGCYFEDEARRGGMVLITGKLKDLTTESYSWAFCIFAWGMLTLSVSFVIQRIASLIMSPPQAEAEAAEDEEKAVSASEPLAA